MPNEPEFTSFTDHRGKVWTPVLLAPDFIDLCHQAGITLESLAKLRLNVGDVPIALWFSVRRRAVAIGIKTMEDFFEGMPLDVMKNGMVTLWNNVMASFPEFKGTSGPLARVLQSLSGGPGASETSSNSTSPQESTPDAP